MQEQTALVEDLHGFKGLVPPGKSWEKDRRHRIERTGDAGQQLKELLNELEHGTWHLGVNEIRIPTNGRIVNTHPEGSARGIYRQKGVHSLLTAASLREAVLLATVGLDELDPDLCRNMMNAFEGMPEELRHFWSRCPENKRFPFLVIILNCLSNLHRDSKDGDICVLLAAGSFDAYVCMPYVGENGVRIKWRPGDLLYLRSADVPHQVTDVKADESGLLERWNLVWIMHRCVLEGRVEYGKDR
jgi:hypothetical protein